MSDAKQSKPLRFRFSLLSAFLFLTMAGGICYVPRLRFELERKYEEDLSTKIREVVDIEGLRIASYYELDYLCRVQSAKIAISVPRSYLIGVTAAETDSEKPDFRDISMVTQRELHRVETTAKTMLPEPEPGADPFPRIFVSVHDDARTSEIR